MINQVEKGYKFRIYPNKTQQKQLEIMFGCARFVYNYFLAKSEEDYKQGKRFSSTYDNQKLLTSMKKDTGFAFLKLGDSQSLNQALANLGLAYDRLFKKISDKPKLKKKSYAQSYTTFVAGSTKSLKIQDNRIFVPKVGWVKLVQHRSVYGRITSGTVRKTASGKYFISLHCKDSEVFEFEETGSEIGFDLGVGSLLIDQNGNKIENPCHIKKTLDKIKLEEQRLQAKTGAPVTTRNKGSNLQNCMRN